MLAHARLRRMSKAFSDEAVVARLAKVVVFTALCAGMFALVFPAG